MKKWLIVSTALTLTACSGGQATYYYQLPQPAVLIAADRVDSKPLKLWVKHVTIPDFLAGNGIAYQTSEVQYTLASHNQWASPLEQQLENSLVANLGSALPGWVVATAPLESSQETLNVNVTGFQGRYDGKVVVSGEWLLYRGKDVIKRPFHVELTQHGDGYPALVKTLGEAWQQVSMQIATQVAVR